MRRLNLVFIFLLAYALFVALCAVFSEPGSVASFYEGYNFAGDYTPSDEELGIVVPDSADEDFRE